MSITYNSRIVRDGLVLNLDAGNIKSYPGTGTTWYDISGNNRNGTLTNGPTFSSSNNGSIVFDGINDRVNIANFNYPASWNDAFSIETAIYIPVGSDWHNTTIGSNSGTAIIGRGSYAGSHGLLRADTQLFRFWTRTDSGSYASTFSGAAYDTWYVLIGTYDGTTNSLYINGNLVESTAVVKSGIPDSSAWAIGGSIAFGGNNGSYGAGNIPFVKIYNRALTASEVAQNFEACRGRFGI